MQLEMYLNFKRVIQTGETYLGGISVRFFSVAHRVNNLLAMQETWVQSLGQEDPLEKGMVTHSSFLPGEFHGQGSLVGYSPWGRRVGHY